MKRSKHLLVLCFVMVFLASCLPSEDPKEVYRILSIGDTIDFSQNVKGTVVSIPSGTCESIILDVQIALDADDIVSAAEVAEARTHYYTRWNIWTVTYKKGGNFYTKTIKDIAKYEANQEHCWTATVRTVRWILKGGNDE